MFANRVGPAQWMRKMKAAGIVFESESPPKIAGRWRKYSRDGSIVFAQEIDGSQPHEAT